MKLLVLALALLPGLASAARGVSDALPYARPEPYPPGRPLDWTVFKGAAEVFRVEWDAWTARPQPLILPLDAVLLFVYRRRPGDRFARIVRPLTPNAFDCQPTTTDTFKFTAYVPFATQITSGCMNPSCTVAGLAVRYTDWGFLVVAKAPPLGKGKGPDLQKCAVRTFLWSKDKLDRDRYPQPPPALSPISAFG